MISAYNVFQQGEMPDKYKILNICLLDYLNVIEAQSDVRDERITKAIRYIRTNLSGKLLCQEVADAVCLSQSRFSHLFRAQVGMTFASYVIYQRILYVYAAVFEGKSITEAIIDAGFSSSSHFADVHRRVFGLPITNVTRNCLFIKV
jgi:methylphosphotriester-DNA--protein-cysteine methyltransferase